MTLYAYMYTQTRKQCVRNVYNSDDNKYKQLVYLFSTIVYSVSEGWPQTVAHEKQLLNLWNGITKAAKR